MTDIPEHHKKYWQFEYDVMHRYYIPLFRNWGLSLKDKKVLDIGCGEGGGLSALFDAGMHCEGFDLDERRVQTANLLKGERSISIQHGNLFEAPHTINETSFDLVILHDVIEHIEDRSYALRIISKYLNKSGRLFITFPPYYSAFGGHQQLLRKWWSLVPFIHLSPFFGSLLSSLVDKEHPFADEIKKIHNLRLGIRRFESLLDSSDVFEIEQHKLYFMRPEFLRFGIKSIGAGFLGRIPGLRELTISGVAYLLRTREMGKKS